MVSIKNSSTFSPQQYFLRPVHCIVRSLVGRKNNCRNDNCQLFYKGSTIGVKEYTVRWLLMESRCIIWVLWITSSDIMWFVVVFRLILTLLTLSRGSGLETLTLCIGFLSSRFRLDFRQLEAISNFKSTKILMVFKQSLASVYWGKILTLTL